ncbi:MarR family winged helix-turn-helix transcriptional regulator [Pedobacter gandavensis]|uniref:MarR family winged helix-turn-helix transcriptional regulator n=1 Tax=Pedobacter gandavensis TaxID=2679963 RepID=UPI0029319DF8|nr:MarR family winged helix-turn-helix transcriptional regulator [Pedobacter gandavensis]
MYYDLIKEVVDLIEDYENESDHQNPNVESFSQWLNDRFKKNESPALQEPEWLGKSKGRSADSVINTSLVHLSRYAKLQAKAAIANTAFSTPDDFIYLISLVAFGSMNKTALIKLNVHEKSAGIQIINRLISTELVEQTTINSDKRNRMIHITAKGRQLLNESMENIRAATKNVTEPLSYEEKMELIMLLTKLEDFHESKARS